MCGIKLRTTNCIYVHNTSTYVRMYTHMYVHKRWPIRSKAPMGFFKMTNRACNDWVANAQCTSVRVPQWQPIRMDTLRTHVPLHTEVLRWMVPNNVTFMRS